MPKIKTDDYGNVDWISKLSCGDCFIHIYATTPDEDTGYVEVMVLSMNPQMSTLWQRITAAWYILWNRFWDDYMLFCTQKELDTFINDLQEARKVMVSSAEACPNCDGKGTFYTTSVCPDCAGSGKLSQGPNVEVHIL